ncbi:MAG: TrmJ/YjtD family RNA methyltransferase [Candidatus Micrarchaeota archaeon]
MPKPRASAGALPQIRVVAVRTLYSGNLGSIARAMKNFGAGELVLVKPRASVDREAIRLAKHATDILENAKTAKSVAAACKGCSFIAGTTGIIGRYGKKIKNCVSPAELAAMAGGQAKVALVFGSEGVGLNEKELAQCDAVCSIPTTKEYPVMNLSHSAAVMLYALAVHGKRIRHYKAAGRAQSAQLEKMFLQIASSQPAVRDAKKVSKAFANILRRARPADDEAQALFAVLRALGGNKTTEKRKKQK